MSAPNFSTSDSKSNVFFPSKSLVVSSSEQTTSVPDLTSISSSSSNHKAEKLRLELQLVRTDLKKRELELDRLTNEQIGEDLTEIEPRIAVGLVDDVRLLRLQETTLRQKINDIASVCQLVIGNVDKAEARQKSEEIERIDRLSEHFRREFARISNRCSHFEQENGKLRTDRVKLDTKIVAIVHENAFLRSENEYLRDESQNLKSQLFELQKNDGLWKARVADLEQKHHQSLGSVKINVIDEQQQLLDSHKLEIESLNRELLDRKREFTRFKTGMKSLNAFLEKEKDRSDSFAQELTLALEQLTLDNRRLLEQIQEQRQTMTQDRMNEGLKMAKFDRQAEQIDGHSPSNKREKLREYSDLTMWESRLQKADTLIACFENQIETLLQVDRSRDNSKEEIVAKLKLNCRELVQSRHEIKLLRANFRKLTEQKDGLTMLLVEMSRDMRTLLDAHK